MVIRYHGTDLAVLPGDRVRLRRWFRYGDGLIVHVPGISPKHKDFSDDPIQEVGLKSNKGHYYGIYVDPATGFLKETVAFTARGTMEGVEVPASLDDPFETKGQ